ncbi:HupE/UreJ family protein [Rhodobacteraceae bacterium M382]|nr:HupE/UreJ family protein [Rhodobacteraceae bacterium M382]
MSRGTRVAKSLEVWTLKLAFVWLVSSVLQFVSPVQAHEVTPTIGDLTVSEGTVRLELRLNVEAFVAGIDLDDLADTNETPQAADYDLLRSLEQDELAPMVRAFAEEWLEDLTMVPDGSVPLVLSDIRIPAVGDADLPRASYLVLSGLLPQGVAWLNVHWPDGSGGLVLRQQGVEEPYTGYLQGGETSPSITLAGGAALSPWEVFIDYIPVGLEHILPKGTDHILFVLGLFFLSARLGPLLWQISAFTVAHTITLALAANGVVQVNPGIVEPLIAASIVYVAVENIIVRRLHGWRPVMVFGFGLLHGLGFASVLGEFGLPPHQFVAALLGFNIGVELGQLAVIAAAFLTVGLWFGRHPKYRGRVAMPASLTIALIGAYWFVERVFLT